MPFVAQVVNTASNAAPLISDLSLGHADIKVLDRRTDSVGKHFKSSKSKITWSFNVKMSCYAVELLTSNFSGKKRVKVNGEFMESAKKDPMMKPQSDPSIMQDNQLVFSADGIKFEITLGSKKSDLLINGYSFSDLNKQRIAKAKVANNSKTIYAAKLVASISDNPERQSSQHVLHLSGSSCGPQDDNASLRSSRLSSKQLRSNNNSSRQLRRSDASVKDITAVCLPSQRSQRGFRRSDASVRDLTQTSTIGSFVGRNSSIRGFRRSDASVRDISLESLKAQDGLCVDGRTSRTSRTSRNSIIRGFRRSDASVRDISLGLMKAQEAADSVGSLSPDTESKLNVVASAFDSNLSLTNYGSNSSSTFDSIPLDDDSSGDLDSNPLHHHQSTRSGLCPQITALKGSGAGEVGVKRATDDALPHLDVAFAQP